MALFWEPSGDEACFDDGVSYACGCCDNWLFLDLVRQSEVREWLDTNNINLGSSDEPASDWLIANAVTSDLYCAIKGEARTIIRSQTLPEEP